MTNDSALSPQHNSVDVRGPRPHAHDLSIHLDLLGMYVAVRLHGLHHLVPHAAAIFLGEIVHLRQIVVPQLDFGDVLLLTRRRSGLWSSLLLKFVKDIFYNASVRLVLGLQLIDFVKGVGEENQYCSNTQQIDFVFEQDGYEEFL